MTKNVDPNLGNNDFGKDTDKNSSRLDDLNITLMGVENDLQKRALSRSRDEVEKAYDFINQAVENGIVDIDCGGCDDDIDDGDKKENGNNKPDEKSDEKSD